MQSKLVAWVLASSWKDLLQEAAWIIGGVVGVVTVTIALYQLWASTKLGAADLRWRRVSGARDILGEIHHHELGSKAVMMLDWYNGEHKYEVAEGRKTEISYRDVLEVLNKDQSACVDEKSTYIRDCFDWFFYYIDRIEFYLQTELASLRTWLQSSSHTRKLSKKIGACMNASWRRPVTRKPKSFGSGSTLLPTTLLSALRTQLVMRPLSLGSRHAGLE